MPPSDPPAHNRKRRDSKPAKWGKRALVEAVQRAAQLTNWMRKKGLPHLLKLMKWVARMTVSLARRFASCLGQKALPRARQIVASLVTALAKLGDQKAKRKRGKSSIRPAERLETAESAPGGAPATPRETEAAPPLVVQNVCEGPDEELLARESPAENHAPEVPVPTRDVPSEEPPRIIEAAPIPQEVPPSVGAVAKRPRKGGSLPLRQFFNTIRSGGLMGLKRWIIPVALLAMAGLIGISLLGKMRRDLWAYYTDGQDLRAEVEEDKTRFVLWQDPEAHHFDKTPPQKDASEEQPQPASKHLPGRLEAAFSPDGTQMILVRWEEHETNADLFVSHWDGRLWSPPEAIKSINTSSDERSPAFSRDGQFLYFSSNREGGKGGLDLYLARRNGSQWEGVVSLGDKINTADDESGPALSSDDKQLFFSSNREGAKGEDIFVADSVAGTRKAEDKLAPVPRFLEAEAVSHLNSRAHDVQAALTARGNHVFLASDRDSSGRKGYAVYFSRVVAGVSLKPEKVDLYIGQGNVTDPAVRMDGFDLLFSANHETDSSEDNPNYRLYRSTTREVIGYTDLSRWEQFKELLGNVAWWLILAIVALIALIYLLESWQDISSLFHKCLAGSAIVHLLMLVGMAALVIAQELEKQAELPPSEIQISLDALTEEEIAAADVVLLACDIEVDDSRFAGKRIYRASTGAALKRAKATIEAALAEAEVESDEVTRYGPSAAKSKGSIKDRGVYKHLLTGVSFMLPMVVAGGLCIALSFVFGIHAADQKGSFAAALMQIGAGSAFKLMVPVLAGYIAYSIADRPGLTPGFIGGWLATDLGAGFIGGIIAGFLAGYAALAVKRYVPLPASIQSLKPILIIPLLSSLATGLIMIYVIGTPVAAILEALKHFLNSMGSTDAVLLGLLLGGMMCFDMGGPINKAAYTFGVGLLSTHTYLPMAAIMAGGMVPPLGLGLASLIARPKFDTTERESGKAAVVLGLCFITEGAIPFAARDPLRVIPCCVLGGATAGGLSMYFGCKLMAPHGGLFVLLIPNAVTHVAFYLAAIAAGSAVTGFVYAAIKRRPAADAAPAASNADPLGLESSSTA